MGATKKHNCSLQFEPSNLRCSVHSNCVLGREVLPSWGGSPCRLEACAEHIHYQCMRKRQGGPPFNVYTCIIIFMKISIMKDDINMFSVIRKVCMLW